MIYFFFLFFAPIVYLTLFCFSLQKLFSKAGKEKECKKPITNIIAWLEIIDKPKWWLILFFVPVINYMTIYSMSFEMAYVFGIRGWFNLFKHGALNMIFLPLLSKNEKAVYTNPKNVKAKVVTKGGKAPAPKREGTNEWLDSIVYALIAATVIRALLFEAYNIPTSSMERTLRVGDFLFVSKFHYGPRLPMTPIAFPLAHHTLPILNTKAYTDIIQLPYWRLPGLQKIKRNDMVVFNLPSGDTLTKEWDSRKIYYDMVRDSGVDYVFRNYNVVTRPVDKRENYIKRCVAIAGDTLKIEHDVLFINKELAYKPENMQHSYMVVTNGTPLTVDHCLEYDFYDIPDALGPYHFRVCATSKTMDKIKNLPYVDTSYRFPDSLYMSPNAIYPHQDEIVKWNSGDFGPLWVPEKGKSIKLNSYNVAVYSRLISVYENNKFEVKNGKYFINGKESTEYTFKMNYYWMMGDNRNNSQDSRYWGFVPEDHVVGKAWMIWMSLDSYKSIPSSIRVNRIGTFVHRAYSPN